MMNDKILQTVTSVFDVAVEYAILLIELVGVCVLLWAVGRAVVDMLRKKAHLRLHLAEGIALALEIKIGSELLRTVTVREMTELYILAAVVLLRAAMTFLIHWEIKLERKNSEAQRKTKEENT